MNSNKNVVSNNNNNNNLTAFGEKPILLQLTHLSYLIEKGHKLLQTNDNNASTDEKLCNLLDEICESLEKICKFDKFLLKHFMDEGTELAATMRDGEKYSTKTADVLAEALEAYYRKFETFWKKFERLKEEGKLRDRAFLDEQVLPAPSVATLQRLTYLAKNVPMPRLQMIFLTIISFYNRINGDVKTEMGNYVAAIDYYREAQQYIYKILGKQSNENKTSHPHEITKIKKSIQQLEYLALGYYQIALCYLKQKNYAKAREYADLGELQIEKVIRSLKRKMGQSISKNYEDYCDEYLERFEGHQEDLRELIDEIESENKSSLSFTIDNTTQPIYRRLKRHALTFHQRSDFKSGNEQNIERTILSSTSEDDSKFDNNNEQNRELTILSSTSEDDTESDNEHLSKRHKR